VILGLDAADAGTALIGGHPYRQLRQPLRHVGALLDAAALQPGRYEVSATLSGFSVHLMPRVRGDSDTR